MGLQLRRKGIMERFTALIEVDTNGCWLWKGNISNYGYGRFRPTPDQKVNVHSWIYDACNPSPRSKGWHVHHACENRRCVNPNHLVAMTKREHETETMNLHRSRKTHCVNGHLWIPANLAFYPSDKGVGQCLLCARVHKARYRAKQLAA